jgi:hypothetical protein
LLEVRGKNHVELTSPSGQQDALPVVATLWILSGVSGLPFSRHSLPSAHELAQADRVTTELVGPGDGALCSILHRHRPAHRVHGPATKRLPADSQGRVVYRYKQPCR